MRNSRFKKETIKKAILCGLHTLWPVSISINIFCFPTCSIAYLFRFLLKWISFCFDFFARKRKRIKAQVNVKYRKDDVVSRTKIQLSCDTEGEPSRTWGGSSADETQTEAKVKRKDTLHYQRLRKAEEA